MGLNFFFLLLRNSPDARGVFVNVQRHKRTLPFVLNFLWPNIYLNIEDYQIYSVQKPINLFDMFNHMNSCHKLVLCMSNT